VIEFKIYDDRNFFQGLSWFARFCALPSPSRCQDTFLLFWEKHLDLVWNRHLLRFSKNMVSHFISVHMVLVRSYSGLQVPNSLSTMQFLSAPHFVFTCFHLFYLAFFSRSVQCFQLAMPPKRAPIAHVSVSYSFPSLLLHKRKTKLGDQRLSASIEASSPER